MSSFEGERRDREHRTERATSWRRWAPFVVVLTLVIGAICAATFRIGKVAFEWIARHPGMDKALHFVMLGALAFALNWALRGRALRLGRVSLQVGGLLVGIAITVEEISQLWVSTRSFDWGDLGANYAGIACADWLARRWLRSVSG